MKMKIIFFQDHKNNVLEFISKLNLIERAEVLACLKSIEDLGFDSPRVEFRKIFGKLWEIKIRTVSSAYRIFYARIEKGIIILLHAYKKKSQKAPLKEIELAKKRLFEVMKNEDYYFD